MALVVEPCTFGDYCRFGAACVYYHQTYPDRNTCEECQSRYCRPHETLCQPCSFKGSPCPSHPRCRLNGMCTRQHGDTDTRTVCTACRRGYCKRGHSLCWYCNEGFKKTHRERLCRFYDRGHCNRGIECFWMHGIHDSRPSCTNCKTNKVSRESSFQHGECTECSR